MEDTSKEVLRTSGVVQALKQHDERRYSIKVGEEWYSGFGSCLAEKSSVYVIEYTLNGRFRNITRIREVGEAVAGAFSQQHEELETRAEELPSVPIAVRNYLTPTGWHQTGITVEDDELIQKEIRKRNCQIASESLEDARRLLGAFVSNAVTPRNVLELALRLSERRTVHVSRVYEEFLKAKIAAERIGIQPEMTGMASDEEVGP